MWVTYFDCQCAVYLFGKNILYKTMAFFFPKASMSYDPVTKNQYRIVLLYGTNRSDLLVLHFTASSILYEYLLRKFSISLQ